ncbi:MAG: hypothetical protein EXS46_00520 [Candidatus Taylorbacteria bacterium]|nr:hypothetical protein [Candidatus Taylorbacteria bacterium]
MQLRQKIKNIPILGDLIMIFVRLPSFVKGSFLTWKYYSKRHASADFFGTYIITDVAPIATQYEKIVSQLGGDILKNNPEGDHVEITPVSFKNRGLFSIMNEVLDEISMNNEKSFQILLQNTMYNNSPDENMWNYYFEPIDNSADKRFPYNLFFNTRPFFNSLFPHRPKLVSLFNKVFKSRIKIKSEILEKAELFVRTNFANKKIVGVYYRGTNIMISIDSVSQMYRKALHEEYFIEIDSLLANGYDAVFLSTDDEKIFPKFKERYGSRLLYYAENKNGLNTIIFVDYTQKPPKIPKCFTPREFGEGALINSILLAKCDFFVSGLSNVSAVIKYFNPKIPFKNLDIKYTNKYMQDIVSIGMFRGLGNFGEGIRTLKFLREESKKIKNER